MSNRALILLIAFLTCGCMKRGPIYVAHQVQTDSDGTVIVLEKRWERMQHMGFDDYRPQKTEYYAAALDFGGAHPIPAPAQSFARDGSDASSKFRRTPGRGWVQLRERIEHDVSIGPIIANGDHRVITFPATSFENTRTAFAVTRSGRHVLIVDDDGLTIRDLWSGDAIEHTRDHPLIIYRNLCVRYLAAAGPWFLTDDLRYIVAPPPYWDHSGGALGSPPSAPVHVADLNINLQKEGLVYDRTEHRASKFVAEFTVGAYSATWQRISDAESLDGELRLLYGARGGYPGDALLLTDSSCHVKKDARLPLGNAWPTAVEWDTQRGCVHVLECSVSSPLIGGEDHPPDWRIHTWNYSGDGAVTTTVLPGSLIRSRINDAPGH